MIEINSKADLNRAVANALHPEPPASERRAIHESGVWRWAPRKLCWCRDCRDFTDTKRPVATTTAHDVSGHWEPADFCGDPCASKLLRQHPKLNADISIIRSWHLTEGEGLWRVLIVQRGVAERYYAIHEDAEVALALAVLRALGVEFTLVEGWDADSCS